MKVLKRTVRRVFAAMGYSIRSIDHKDRVSGIELVQDVRLLLQGKADPLVFDVGANTGQTIELMRSTFPRPRIFSFEPSPKSFDSLRAKYGLDKSITLENAALGNSEG